MRSAPATRSAVVKSSASEGGVVGWGGEGEMHLGGAAAEKSGGVEVEAGVFSGEFGGARCAVRKEAGVPRSCGAGSVATVS